jgi:hypothetical protein
VSATKYANGKYTIAECDRCGFRYKRRVLKELTINEKPSNLQVCPQCWEPDHPQYKVGKYPVVDPQAIMNPRPDRSLSDTNVTTSSRYIPGTFNPLSGVQSSGTVGTVTVSTS